MTAPVPQTSGDVEKLIAVIERTASALEQKADGDALIAADLRESNADRASLYASDAGRERADAIALRAALRTLHAHDAEIARIRESYEAHLETRDERLQALEAELAEARGERDEWRRLAGGGCDALEGGPHNVVVQPGGYKFCANCGETVKNPTLAERARKAEEALALARKGLENAKLQIQYLHEKFGETGSGNGVLAQIDETLSGGKKDE